MTMKSCNENYSSRYCETHTKKSENRETNYKLTQQTLLTNLR